MELANFMNILGLFCLGFCWLSVNKYGPVGHDLWRVDCSFFLIFGMDNFHFVVED